MNVQAEVTVLPLEMGYSQTRKCHKYRKCEKTAWQSPFLVLNCGQTNAAFMKDIAIFQIEKFKSGKNRMTEEASESLEYKNNNLF